MFVNTTPKLLLVTPVGKVTTMVWPLWLHVRRALELLMSTQAKLAPILTSLGNVTVNVDPTAISEGWPSLNE